MKRIYILSVLLLFAALLPACRKDAPELMNPNERQLCRTTSQVFEAFWHGMNSSYAFWDIDPTDWDRVYDEYLPRFRALDDLETLDNETLLALYTEACRDLIDHHLAITVTNIDAPDPKSNTIVLQPGMNEAMTRDYYHDPILGGAAYGLIKGCIEAYKSAGRIEEYADGLYLDEDHLDMATEAISYKIDGVIYFRLSAFTLSGVLELDPEGPVAQVVRNYHRMILETPDIKGVIIDVRDNFGGMLADMQQILAPLIDTETLIGYTRSKEGLGRLDYGPWVPCILAPAEQHRKVEAPVVVLTNIWSVSMSEMTSMAVSVLPNGCIVGERTFGGTGPLVGDYTFAYSGAASNACVKIYTSTSVMKDAKGVIHEGVGITPDIESLQDEQGLLNGVDGQLERALEYIRTGK